MEMMEFLNTINSHISRDTGSKENVMKFVLNVKANASEEIYYFNLTDCHLVDVTDIWNFAVEHVAPSMFDYNLIETYYKTNWKMGKDLTGKEKLPETFDGKVSNDVRMPFDKPTLLFTEHSDLMNHQDDGWSAFVLFHRKNAPVDGQFVVFCISFSSHGLTETQLCFLSPDGRYISNWRDRAQTENDRHSELFFNQLSYQCAAALATMNNPRHVTFVPAANRTKRKLAHRGMGTAMDAMHRVAWDVDKPVKAKTPHDETFHKMPYHYRRGYWRKCDKDNPRAERRLQAPNYRDRFLWWMWIDGYWAGHPMFGIKKQYWQPRKKKDTA